MRLGKRLATDPPRNHLRSKRLGWETIRATVLDDAMEADDLALAEIDENLPRGELQPAERAIHVQKRKGLYERRHPETKHAGAPGKPGGGKKAKAAELALPDPLPEKR